VLLVCQLLPRSLSLNSSLRRDRLPRLSQPHGQHCDHEHTTHRSRPVGGIGPGHWGRTMRQELRDGKGRLLGWTEKSGVRIEGMDSRGRLKGWYHPSVNETYDARGRLVGRCNLLSALILTP